MKKLILLTCLVGSAVTANAQKTTITAYGEAKITTDGKNMVINCDTFRNAKCFFLETNEVVNVGAQVTVKHPVTSNILVEGVLQQFTTDKNNFLQEIVVSVK